MTPRWILSVANCFLLAFAVDAGLSLCEEALRAATGFGGLMGLRNAVASTTGMLGLLCIPLLGLTPRLPVRVLGPAVAGALWLNTGAAPLPFVVGVGPALAFCMVVFQAALAGWVLLSSRSWNGGVGWLLRPEAGSGPAFSLRHSGLSVLVLVFGLLPAAVFYAFASLLAFVQVATEGFVSFDAVGVSLGDRHYRRGEQEVRLVGMMHFGEESAYEEIVQSFATHSTIVLEEGVSDEQLLMGPVRLYEPVAESLGLVGQQNLASYLVGADDGLPEWPVLRNVDVDVSEFDPATLEWLRWVSEIWTGSDPLAALLEMAGGSESERQLAAVQHDILDMRNERLLAAVVLALGEYTNVIVPWGALHLPFIEGAIRERGFEESRRSRHRLLSWMTVLAALF
jgi:hypothetical protein